MVFPPKIVSLLKKPATSSTRKNALQEDLGTEGEDIAADYLNSEGFKIAERNFRLKTGEIDIIATRGGELHFFEVKTRTDPGMVSPFESITEAKKKRMRRTARIYLNNYRNNFNYKNLPPCYFGVIGIDIIGGEPRVECILDAFE